MKISLLWLALAAQLIAAYPGGKLDPRHDGGGSSSSANDKQHNHKSTGIQTTDTRSSETHTSQHPPTTSSNTGQECPSGSNTEHDGPGPTSKSKDKGQSASDAKQDASSTSDTKHNGQSASNTKHDSHSASNTKHDSHSASNTKHDSHSASNTKHDSHSASNTKHDGHSASNTGCGGPQTPVKSLSTSVTKKHHASSSSDSKKPHKSSSIKSDHTSDHSHTKTGHKGATSTDGFSFSLHLPSQTHLSFTSSTTAAPLPIITVHSLSTQVTSIPGVTSNKEVTTTDSSGHHVVVPFLFGCWFCKGGGLLLWDLPPAPGIYLPPVPPPFPGFPKITIGSDHVPTPAPSKEADPSKSSPESDASSSKHSSSTSKSTSSCSRATVTDYWVECPSATSGPSSKCSTYSSAKVTGCSVTQKISTSVSACTKPASVDNGALLPGETYGLEYNFYDPTLSATEFPYTYTVAVLESTGIVGGKQPSVTSGHSRSGTTKAKSSQKGSSKSSGKASTSKSSHPASVTAAPTGDPICIPFEDPDHSIDTGYCQCSSGKFFTTTPYLKTSGNPCGYTSLKIPSSTHQSQHTPVTTVPFPFTTHDMAGDKIACASSTRETIDVPGGPLTFTYCAGSKTTISTAPVPFPFTTHDMAGDKIACASSTRETIDVPGGPLTFTYCAGSKTTISTATPTPSPPPKPTADCKFWDEGWGYTFEVYNIQGWSNDGGDALEQQEDGCGALTGWSYDHTNSGGDATFNLPFFIADGCVERAVASAGGPELSCVGEGWGKRSVLGDKLKGLRPSGGASHAKALPDFNDTKIVDAYNPPNTDITTTKHAYKPAVWDKTTRRSLAQVLSQQKERRSLLQKRGCIPSKPKQSAPNPPNPPNPVAAVPQVCNPIIPGVDECNEQVAAYGNVGRKTSLFYTGWEGVPNGQGGTFTRKYATKHMCNMDTVSWSGLVDGDWLVDVQKAIIEPFRKPGMTQDEIFALNDKADPFLKNLSQAFAEKSKGDVYVFIPKSNTKLANNNWDKSSAWGGWEFPALTINTDVARIYRVDLDTTDANNPTGTPELIFDRSKGQGKAYEPKGLRGPSLPEGLPQDQIPANWQQPGSL